MTSNANQNPSKTVSPMQDKPGSSPIVTPPEHERHKPGQAQPGQAQPGRSPGVQPSEREPQHKPGQAQPGNSPARQS